MKRTFFAPAILLLLGACAADGTSMAEPTVSTVTPSPASASVSTVPQSTAPQTIGQIVRVEPLAPVSQRGGNAALQIGTSILGALIPGPWGSVASVATGQVGGLAMNSADTKSARYHVLFPDGSTESFTQSQALTLGVGTPVQVVTGVDGSRELVQTGLPVIPAATTISSPSVI